MYDSDARNVSSAAARRYGEMAVRDGFGCFVNSFYIQYPV